MLLALLMLAASLVKSEAPLFKLGDSAIVKCQIKNKERTVSKCSLM